MPISAVFLLWRCSDSVVFVAFHCITIFHRDQHRTWVYYKEHGILHRRSTHWRLVLKARCIWFVRHNLQTSLPLISSNVNHSQVIEKPRPVLNKLSVWILSFVGLSRYLTIHIHSVKLSLIIWCFTEITTVFYLLLTWTYNNYLRCLIIWSKIL